MIRSAAILVAAGSGRRAGDGAPKQLRELAGIPVLQRAWAPFAASEAIGEIVLVVPEETAQAPPTWLRKGPGRLVAGGATRTDSVRRGLLSLGLEVETVLVHDGVRPFASEGLVGRVLSAASGGPVVPLLPVVDTVKEVDGSGIVLRTLERSALRRAQTPQGFPAGLLRRLHEAAARAGRSATDDAALCEEAGHRVVGILGEETNLKLTTPADFDFATWLLETGRVQ